MGAQAKPGRRSYPKVWYGVHTLVYFEMHSEMIEAIQHEKQLKKWNRSWKIELLEKTNPSWRDLWQDIVLRSIFHGTLFKFIDGSRLPRSG